MDTMNMEEVRRDPEEELLRGNNNKNDDDKNGEDDDDEDDEETRSRRNLRQSLVNAGFAATSSINNDLVDFTRMDPNQTYVLSGPFLRYDSNSRTYLNVFTARPVPSGMTVIATPAHAPIVQPTLPVSMSIPSSQFNPNAAPFIPRQQEANANKRSPTFMYWSANCPEGKLIPLRQPQPPVYFHSAQPQPTS